MNEETKDANTSPGQAGILSMFILLFIFLLAIIAIQTYLPQSDIMANQANILYFFAQQISGIPLAYLMIVAVLSSTVATTQTTLLPSSRLTFSMARDGVFPKAFGRVHSSWKTPWVGTIISSLLAVIVIVLTVTSDKVNTVFGRLILDIGVLVAVYYGVTGLASAWAFRKVLFSSVRLLIAAGILPFVGGLFLLAIGGYVTYQSWISDIAVALPILVTVALGIPLMVLAAIVNRSGFFREKTVSYIKVDGQLTASPAGPPG